MNQPTPNTDQASTRSFGAFRIAFGLYILFIIFKLYPFRDIYFDQLPGINEYRFPVKLFLATWAVSAFMLAAGLLTRVFSIINYVLIVIATSLFSIIHIGSFNDDILRIMGLMMILLPVSSSFSLDALMAKMAGKARPEITYKINYQLVLIISLGVIYTGSAVTKLFSPLWQEGLGLWKPYVIPSKRWLDISMLMNNLTIMKFLNYAVLAWELIFVFIFFKKGFRLFFAITGILLHVFIAMLFPFPLYCLGPLICYILFIPDSFWNRLCKYFTRDATFDIHYHPQSASAVRWMNFLKAFDYRKKFTFTPGVAGFEIPLSGLSGEPALQLLLKQYLLLRIALFIRKITAIRHRVSNSYHTLITDFIPRAEGGNVLPNPGRQKLFVSFCVMLISIQIVIQVYGVYSMLKTASQPAKINFLTLDSRRYDLSFHPINMVRNLFGINKRGLFLDASSTGKLKVIRIAELNQGQEKMLPLYNDKGYCQYLIRDFNWTLFAHHYFLTPAGINVESLKKFTSFWMRRENLNPDQTSFRIYSRTYTMPADYEPDYLRKMEVLPWLTEGQIDWKDSSFYYTPALKDTVQ